MPELETVQLNGQHIPWRDGLTVADLLPQPGRVATALNGRFLPQAERSTTVLVPGDRLTVFTAIVAG